MKKGMVVSTLVSVILLVVAISIIMAIVLGGRENFFTSLLKAPSFIIASLISAILSAVGL